MQYSAAVQPMDVTATVVQQRPAGRWNSGLFSCGNAGLCCKTYFAPFSPGLLAKISTRIGWSPFDRAGEPTNHKKTFRMLRNITVCGLVCLLASMAMLGCGVALISGAFEPTEITKKVNTTTKAWDAKCTQAYCMTYGQCASCRSKSDRLASGKWNCIGCIDTSTDWCCYDRGTVTAASSGGCCGPKPTTVSSGYVSACRAADTHSACQNIYAGCQSCAPDRPLCQWYSQANATACGGRRRLKKFDKYTKKQDDEDLSKYGVVGWALYGTGYMGMMFFGLVGTVMIGFLMLLRFKLRAKFNIPASHCGLDGCGDVGGMAEDFCCVNQCPACTTAQMARQVDVESDGCCCCDCCDGADPGLHPHLQQQHQQVFVAAHSLHVVQTAVTVANPNDMRMKR